MQAQLAGEVHEGERRLFRGRLFPLGLSQGGFFHAGDGFGGALRKEDGLCMSFHGAGRVMN